MTISVSQRAKEQLALLGLNGRNYLRIRVVAGGCAGLAYSAAIEEQMTESDRIVYEDGPVRVISDLQSLMYLNGLEIDYSDDLLQGGFRFKNPNALKTCGCGASFQA